MIVKFTGKGSYYAHPHLFDEKDRRKEVNKKLGKYLLDTGYFEEIKEVKNKTKTETERKNKIQKEMEAKASREKKKYDKAKEESKKKDK